MQHLSCIYLKNYLLLFRQCVDQCDGSGVLQKFAGSYQILLFTLSVVLASTAFLFLGKKSLYSALWTLNLETAFILFHKLNEDEN